MAIPTTPRTADKAPFNQVQPIQSLLVTQLVANVTNIATSATQVTGLTATSFKIGTAAQYVRVIVAGNSITNSGANNVVISLWVGTVGTGTQVGTYTDSAQSSAPSPLTAIFYMPVAAANTIAPGSTYVFNVGMHGSGAGTNTLAASATAPCTMTVEVL